MPTYVDHNYFKELGKGLPAELCRNERCRYDLDTKTYTLTLWGDEYIVDWAGCTIVQKAANSAQPHEFFYLFAIYYLLLPEDISPQGEWISEKDLPGGATFFRGPHLLPTHLISDHFANDLQRFCDCCQRLGGNRENLADAAFSFNITYDIKVLVLYWTGDEDFPAEAKILYDKSIARALPLDIVFALAFEICCRLAGTSTSA